MERGEKNMATKSKGGDGKAPKKMAKSKLVKAIREGKDVGRKGKGFEDLAEKAGKRYGSAEIGRKVAAAAMWKNLAKKSGGKRGK